MSCLGKIVTACLRQHSKYFTHKFEVISLLQIPNKRPGGLA